MVICKKGKRSASLLRNKLIKTRSYEKTGGLLNEKSYFNETGQSGFCSPCIVKTTKQTMR